MKRVGVVLHAGRPEAASTARTLAERLVARGVEVCALADDAQRIGSPDVESTEHFSDDLDLVFVFGGDGTLLRAAEAVDRTGVPLLGVNFGHLGFLSELERSQLDDGLKRLLDDGFAVEERLVLQGEVTDGDSQRTVRALNDLIVAKGATGRAIRLAMSISGEPLVSWAADGIIVATATGSTAYSFSAGGPVVSPNVDCLIVTPVSPHGLFARSVIVSPHEEILLDVDADPDGALLSADGHAAIRVNAGAHVRVRAADDRIRLAKVEPRPFWRLVREKFRLAPGD